MGGKVFGSAPVDSACKQRKYRVVIIDAGAEVAQVLAIAPKRKGGHQVQSATNGRSGVELVRSMEPDVVISSIEVPGLDGYQVVSSIRESCTKQPLIIAHTGYLKEQIAEHAKAAGFDLFIQRPCIFPDLFRAVASIGGEDECGIGNSDSCHARVAPNIYRRGRRAAQTMH